MRLLYTWILAYPLCTYLPLIVSALEIVGAVDCYIQFGKEDLLRPDNPALNMIFNMYQRVMGDYEAVEW